MKANLIGGRVRVRVRTAMPSDSNRCRCKFVQFRYHSGDVGRNHITQSLALNRHTATRSRWCTPPPSLSFSSFFLLFLLLFSPLSLLFRSPPLPISMPRTVSEDDRRRRRSPCWYAPESRLSLYHARPAADTAVDAHRRTHVKHGPVKFPSMMWLFVWSTLNQEIRRTQRNRHHRHFTTHGDHVPTP